MFQIGDLVYNKNDVKWYGYDLISVGEVVGVEGDYLYVEFRLLNPPEWFPNQYRDCVIVKVHKDDVEKDRGWGDDE